MVVTICTGSLSHDRVTGQSSDAVIVWGKRQAHVCMRQACESMTASSTARPSMAVGFVREPVLSSFSSATTTCSAPRQPTHCMRLERIVLMGEQARTRQQHEQQQLLLRG